jgi:hypothetical protein
MFLMSSAKLGMNLLRKFTFPTKDYNSLMFLGWSNFWMDSILLGSILIPYLYIMCLLIGGNNCLSIGRTSPVRGCLSNPSRLV